MEDESMRRVLTGAVVVALVATWTFVALAGGHSCGASAQASCSSSCSPAKGASAASACENAHGTLTGNFDPAMSTACRYACASKLKHDAKDVLAQPGAK